MDRFYTIGMAGHIDHGKTSLTKALTGINTDRLKEEQVRNISIEPGFANFIEEEQLEVSIIDVPGHERFIRQMIAGVAGIDMVILVIAADEGIMPQTKEHLDILSLLDIKNGLIVMTKIDQAEEELLEIIVDDVKEQMKQTFLADAPIYFVDSLSQRGIPELKEALKDTLLSLPTKVQQTSFRLPIDQVFTVKGLGVVVRGTVFNGEVKQGEHLRLLPDGKEVRVRQIQRHHQQKTVAREGQRTAINIGSISSEDVSRGDVLVSDDFFTVSDQIDVVFYPLKDFKYKLKQRQLIKLHIGTSEVMGRIVFFDRNEVRANESEEILCQLRLDEKIVVTRGDRFIVRRPTPVETIGGGWVIEPNATKHRFGQETIDQLTLQKDGSAKDRMKSLIEEKIVLTRTELLKQTSISKEELNDAKDELLEIEEGLFTLQSISCQVKKQIKDLLSNFHKRYPMRIGMDKAEMTSELKRYPSTLLEFVVELLRKSKEIKVRLQYISLANVNPTLPPEWEMKLERAEKELVQQGVEVDKWSNIFKKYQIPADIQKEFYHFLIQTEKAYKFDSDRLISKMATKQALKKLSTQTALEDFNLQTARDILQLTRKNLVPLLELLDHLGYTKRNGNMRTWIKKI